MKTKTGFWVVTLRILKMLGWIIAAVVVFIISVPFIACSNLETLDF